MKAIFMREGLYQLHMGDRKRKKNPKKSVLSYSCFFFSFYEMDLLVKNKKSIKDEYEREIVIEIVRYNNEKASFTGSSRYLCCSAA